ncbi:tRNA (guanine(46)-N(7))-methyltransferase TrmB [Alteromonas gilva]|uniref:tRNA (guanine(46)-N(7))-methyltransferase n=1 Tax=Alteromonas gilva TaxID=2987522 RepID=A0ABT5KYT2_9ALTE|nr:SAM-dependent methyltransferase [Alteromonas gilva]MDC8829938.1 SAM-dependent methyltransferase [Alteromonas gilva]
MQGNSRRVESQQPGVHEKLDAIVAKYQQTENRRPVHKHTRDAFDETMAWLGDWQGDIILDSCCGVGQSTAGLAEQFSDARVIGLDKSDLRVAKHSHYQSAATNYRVVRADVIDFWRLLRGAADSSAWQLKAHYLCYPNPYPKPSQVQKRWHASPAMPDLMALAPQLEVRSNWLIYLQEFAQAAAAYGVQCEITEVPKHSRAITPFELKYRNSGQVCWRLRRV